MLFSCSCCVVAKTAAMLWSWRGHIMTIEHKHKRSATPNALHISTLYIGFKLRELMRHQGLSCLLCLAVIMPRWRLRGSSSSSTSVPQCPATSQGKSPATQTPGKHHSHVPPPPSPAWPTRGRRRTQQRATHFIPRATKKKNPSRCSAHMGPRCVEDMVGLTTETNACSNLLTFSNVRRVATARTPFSI